MSDTTSHSPACQRKRCRSSQVFFVGALAFCVLSFSVLTAQMTLLERDSFAPGYDRPDRTSVLPRNSKEWTSRASDKLPSKHADSATDKPVDNRLPRPSDAITGNTTRTIVHGPVFFNAFVPTPARDGTTRSNYNASHLRQIFREQFGQIRRTEPDARVLYTLIGNDQWKDTVDSLCEGNCVMREYLSEGDEVHTLQAMWDYCQPHGRTGKSGDVLVTYVHDKGSYHSTSANEKARRVGTKAALECRRQMQLAPHKCNVCTSQFHVIPQYLGNANMWTASCSYLRGLYPPTNYSSAMQRMYDETIFHPVRNRTAKYACLRPFHIVDNHLGLGRYSLERWVWSHPHVKPCDVVQTNMGQIDDSSFESSTSWEPKLKRAPHKHPRQIGMQFGFMKSSFARLEGRLFEWDYLYHKPPTNASWVWRWYRGFYTGHKRWIEECGRENATDGVVPT